MLSATRFTMSKPRLLRLLDEMHNTGNETAAVCLPPASAAGEVASFLGGVLDVKQLPEDAVKQISASPTGGILFWGLHHRYLVMPPFPIYEKKASGTCEIEPLHKLLYSDPLLAVVLVRMGTYGIAIVKGDKLVSSKVGGGVVHARHRQGGSSSHRFERHREKQMETFFTRVCLHSREQFEPYARQINYLLYGGTKETILDFRKQCHFLREFDKRTLERLLNIRNPGQAGLKEAIEEAWASTVIQWEEK